MARARSGGKAARAAVAEAPAAGGDAMLAAAAPPLAAALATLRAWLREACPELVEAIKWRRLAFVRKSLFAGMAAFQAHAAFGFWKDALLRHDADAAAMLDRLGRLTGPGDLPHKREFVALVRRAVALDDAGAKVPRAPAKARPPLRLPPAFRAALAATPKARATFDGFSPSCRREYIEWIAEAKQDATRERRIAQAVAWLAEGKRRNWRYER